MLLAHKPENAAAALVLGGAIIGFLPFNLHPARVFLGDTGATAIGFLLGCLPSRAPRCSLRASPR